MSDLFEGSRRVALGEVALNSTRVSIDPEAEGFERYVIGEHIPTDADSVSTWGSVGDGGFGPRIRTIFQPGDVICTTRGPNLKVARVDFRGLCAHTNFVLRTSAPNLLTQQYLEAVVRSKGFQRHLARNFRGSVNLFVNWSDAAKYEFDLPRLDAQERVTAALNGTEVLADRYGASLSALSDLTKRFLLSEFARASRSSSMLRVADVGELKMGRQKAPKYSQGLCPRPFLRVVNVGELELFLADVEQMDFSESELERFRLVPGDVLLTEGDLIGAFNVGRPALFRGEIDDCCFQNTLIRFRPGDRLVPEYALLLFEGARLSNIFARAAKTTTVTHLGLGRLAEVKIPIPVREEQTRPAAVLSALLGARAALRARMHDLAGVRGELLEAAVR